MNQEKIGFFIAKERRSRNYTQKQLADILGISDKTISKWERGIGFPDVSLVQPLCEALGITVNELLNGERLQDGEYQDKAEQTILEFMKNNIDRMKYINSICNWLIILNILLRKVLYIVMPMDLWGGLDGYGATIYDFMFYFLMIQLIMVKIIIFTKNLDEYFYRKAVNETLGKTKKD